MQNESACRKAERKARGSYYVTRLLIEKREGGAKIETIVSILNVSGGEKESRGKESGNGHVNMEQERLGTSCSEHETNRVQRADRITGYMRGDLKNRISDSDMGMNTSRTGWIYSQTV